MYEFLNTHGIYCLFFENDNCKYYIGRSLNMLDRYNIHCRDLRNNAHHNIHLQNAYKKYGEYPSVYVLEVPQISELSDKEIYWIEEFDSFNSGYNRTGGGEGAGYGHTSPSALHDEYTYTTILFMLADTSLNMYQISEELDVSLSIVNSIALGTSHTYLQDKFPDIYYKARSKHGDFSTCRKYNDDIYYSILSDLANTNDKYKILAKKYGVTESVIEDIGRGATHKYLSNKYPELYKKMIDKVGTRRCGPQSGKDYPQVVSPNKEVYTVINATQFAKVHGLHQGHFAELLKGKAKSHKGWTILQ